MAYKTPTKIAFQNRKRFHATQKSNNETISDWFKRLQKCTGDCDFGQIYDCMLIDKFFSGLTESDFEKISQVPVWTVEELILVAIGNAHIFNTKDAKQTNGNSQLQESSTNDRINDNENNEHDRFNIKSEVCKNNEESR